MEKFREEQTSQFLYWKVTAPAKFVGAIHSNAMDVRWSAYECVATEPIGCMAQLTILIPVVRKNSPMGALAAFLAWIIKPRKNTVLFVRAIVTPTFWPGWTVKAFGVTEYGGGLVCGWKLPCSGTIDTQEAESAPFEKALANWTRKIDRTIPLIRNILRWFHFAS